MVPINFLSRLHGYLDSTNIRHLIVNVYNYFSEKKYLHIMECKCPFRKRAFTPSRSHRISGINFSLLVLGFLGRVPNALSFYRTKNVLSWSKSFLPEQKFIYRTRAIITRGLYILYLLFHCGLYSREVSVTTRLCTNRR